MNSNLKSHELLPKDISQIICEKTAKIILNGDKAHVTVQQQLDILNQLGQFLFGQFLLQHRGVNGYWTHYMLSHAQSKNNNKNLSKLETFILEQAPLVLATQERFGIFLHENQKRVKNNANLACIPSGVLGELLYLDFSNINNIKLNGIDCDESVLHEARALSAKLGLDKFLSLHQTDAWNLSFNNEFDLISSNGLNIYEPDEDMVVALYRQFYVALKSGGTLVTSYIAPLEEWDMSQINQNDLLLQKIIFVDIIESKWHSRYSNQQIINHLKMAGFKQVECIYGRTKMFPTVIATKE